MSVYDRTVFKLCKGIMKGLEHGNHFYYKNRSCRVLKRKNASRSWYRGRHHAHWKFESLASLLLNNVMHLNNSNYSCFTISPFKINKQKSDKATLIS